jgi:transcriptional regulator with XRE-family HTH domain
MADDPTLAELLDERRWPLDALALIADIDVSTASRIRSGVRRPQPTTVIRMAQGLGVSVTRMRRILDATWRQAHPDEAAGQ